MANLTWKQRELFAGAGWARRFKNRLQTWIPALTVERVLIISLMVVGLVAHGLNMFNFPSFTLLDDEGIYTNQAWAVYRLGQLSPYTYFYDHSPLGWLLIAGWTVVTGGLYTFGGPIDSGRMLMLLLHVAMVPMLYMLVRKLGGGMIVAALAALLFSLSPLAVFYQRMVLLDNIMLFWALLSLNLLLDGRGRLSRLVLSGLCFGLAVLSKETAVFIVPAMLFIVWQQRWKHQGRFAINTWIVAMVVTVSWYPLYALYSSELFPPDLSFNFLFFQFSTGTNHVSLLQALSWQSSRDGGGMFNPNNQFWMLVRSDWMGRDGLLLAGGSIAAGINLVRGLRNRQAFATGLLGIFPLFYMARGGVVLNYYILFVIPFLCLNLALLVTPLLSRLPRLAAGVVGVIAAAGLVVGYWQSGMLEPLYTQRPGQTAREALAWIKQNVPPQSMIVTRDDLWTDLRDAGPTGPAFPNVHSNWKIAFDPAVHTGILHDDWRRLDYLIMSPGLESGFIDSKDQVSLGALRNSYVVKRWTGDSGIEIELRKVNKPGETETRLLDGSQAYLANQFERDGAFLSADGTASSHSQANALLRAVWTNDRNAFDRAWNWTQANLRQPDGLLSTTWQSETAARTGESKGRVTDAQTAAGANIDTALALLLAAKRWDDPALREAGREMVLAIWKREVVQVNGTPYLAAGDWAGQNEIVVINQSYFSPYAYRIFKEIDPKHNWLGLVSAGYQMLNDSAGTGLGAAGSVGLPPEWVGLNRTTGQLGSLELTDASPNRYGLGAAHIYWRVGLDARWNDDQQARNFLNQAWFLQEEVKRKGYASAMYDRDGAVIEEAANIEGTAGALAALLTRDPATANRLYGQQVIGAARYEQGKVTWGSPDDIFSQEWGWFATALYNGYLTNLWLK